MATADGVSAGAAQRGSVRGWAVDGHTPWVPFSAASLDALSADERAVWPEALLPARGIPAAFDTTPQNDSAGGEQAGVGHTRRRSEGAALVRGISAHRAASGALLSWWVCGPETTLIAEASVCADSALALVGSTVPAAELGNAPDPGESERAPDAVEYAPAIRPVLLVRTMPLAELPNALASLVPEDAHRHAVVLTVSPRTPERAQILAEPTREAARDCLRAEIMRLAVAAHRSGAGPLAGEPGGEEEVGRV